MWSVYTFPDGTTYQGALVDGQPQGEGQLCTAAGVAMGRARLRFCRASR